MVFFSRYFLHLVRSVRKNKTASVVFVVVLVLVAIFGNAVTFYVFDGAADKHIGFGDSIWYSIISMTTIGYGDYSAHSAGARIGTVFFVIIIGLTAFTALLGTVVDWLIDMNFKEKRGMMRMHVSNHILVVNFPSASRVRSILQELQSDPQHAEREIVLVNDQVTEHPFAHMERVSFVSGSPLEQETFSRANAISAASAIVLASAYNDPHSDSVVSSVVTVLEHINPEIRTIAECLDDKHEFLFQATRCDSIVFPLRLANNLIVQETQDTGVSAFIDTLISNRKGETVYSSRLPSRETVKNQSYVTLAAKLLHEGVNLLSIVRDGVNRTNFLDLNVAGDDILVYAAGGRKDQGYFVRLLEHA